MNTINEFTYNPNIPHKADCPSCGRCPACGRKDASPHQHIPWTNPATVPWPNYPHPYIGDIVPNPFVNTCSTDAYTGPELIAFNTGDGCE